MPDLWKTPTTLTGKYVRLEPLSEKHVRGLTEIGLDERIWRLMVYGQMSTETDLHAWVQDMLARQAMGTDLPFAVIHLESGKIAGATRYMEMRPQHKGLEIGGTWYGLEYQRTAVNTESKYLLLKYAFEKMECIRVQFKTDSRNERSVRAIERLGAKREGLLRNHMIMQDGTKRNSLYFSIIFEEWLEIKKRLEGILENG
jgi:N-acetyltransferase